MNRFTEDGWTDVGAVMALHQPFNFLIGGRGTGKTFTTLKECRDQNRCFMFIRRTQNQVDNISSVNTNPLKENALSDGYLFDILKESKGVYSINEVDEEGNLVRKLGYLASLSGMKNLRGMSFADVDTIVFDEFIPESHERPIKNEADAFFNLYETVNRNRELQGRDPVQCLLLANANNLANPILLGFGMVNRVEGMIKRNQYFSMLPDRGIVVVLYPDSEISKKKRKTALYRAIDPSSQFSEMALTNAFSYSDTSGVISRPLDGMRPLFKIDDITIYQSKEARTYYASMHSSGTVPEFSTKSEEDLKRLNFRKSFLALAILGKRVEYETFEIKAKLISIFLGL